MNKRVMHLNFELRMIGTHSLPNEISKSQFPHFIINKYLVVLTEFI